MNKDRGERLVVLLLADAAKPDGAQFDMSVWSKATGTAYRESYPINMTAPIKVDCGTQACALGLAAISGEFAKDGLSWEIYKYWDGQTEGMLVPTFNGDREYNAGKEFFELTDVETAFLFDPATYPYNLTKGAKAETEVVNRIRWLLDGKSTAEYPPIIG